MRLQGGHTWDAVLEVFVWSAMMLFWGKVSSYLPNGEVWQQGAGRLLSGTQLACRAVLMQVRGDWPFLQTLFRFPAWNQTSGMCWKCAATSNEDSHLCYKITGLNAGWRSHRRTPREWIQMCVSQGAGISPLFSLHYFCVSVILLGWLHVVDLVISQDIIGNLFWEI